MVAGTWGNVTSHISVQYLLRVLLFFRKIEYMRVITRNDFYVNTNSLPRDYSSGAIAVYLANQSDTCLCAGGIYWFGIATFVTGYSCNLKNVKMLSSSLDGLL